MTEREGARVYERFQKRGLIKIVERDRSDTQIKREGGRERER